MIKTKHGSELARSGAELNKGVSVWLAIWSRAPSMLSQLQNRHQEFNVFCRVSEQTTSRQEPQGLHTASELLNLCSRSPYRGPAKDEKSRRLRYPHFLNSIPASSHKPRINTQSASGRLKWHDIDSNSRL